MIVIATALVSGLVGVFLFDAGSRLLLIERGRPPALGLWTIPGGRVKTGEPLREACHREVREETGVEIELLDFVTVFERIETEYHYVILDYCGRPVQPASVPVAGDDAASARWVPLDQLSGYQLTQGLMPVIPAALEIVQRSHQVKQ